jgi:TPR repeat protein
LNGTSKNKNEAGSLQTKSSSVRVAAGTFEDAIAAFGRGDYPTAVRLFRPLADRGNVHAQYNLGNMYRNSQGVPQNDAEAVRWFRLAADQGNAGAQFGLGGMYYFGFGVPRDYVTAHMWYDLAAAQGNQDAVKSRGLVEQQMTPAQITEAQKLAREWKPKAAPRWGL